MLLSARAFFLERTDPYPFVVVNVFSIAHSPKCFAFHSETIMKFIKHVPSKRPTTFSAAAWPHATFTFAAHSLPRYHCVTSALPVRYPVRYPVRFSRDPMKSSERAWRAINNVFSGKPSKKLHAPLFLQFREEKLSNALGNALVTHW